MLTMFLSTPVLLFGLISVIGLLLRLIKLFVFGLILLGIVIVASAMGIIDLNPLSLFHFF